MQREPLKVFGSTMARVNACSLSLLLSCCILSGAAEAAVYDVAGFGAKPDGRTDSSTAFADAWSAACRSLEPATVYVPHGEFLLSRAAFAGPCSSRVTVQIDGTLVAPSGYTSRGGSGDVWIVFDHVDGLTMSGGTLDGRGPALWACKAAGHGGCPSGATSLTVLNSRDVVIRGLRSVDSELYHVVIDGCERVAVEDVGIVAPGSSPNTDGIHVQASSGVTVTRASIQTGDDCVSVGPGTANLRVEHVSCGPGHGISIGSLGKESEEAGVENVTVAGASFVGTENGLRIKTWGRAAVEGAYVRGVVFEHAFMHDVRNPIIIDQNYCPNHICPHQSSAVKISDVRYTDIRGSSASQVAVKFDCSATNPCSGIGLRDIKLTLDGGKPAEATCQHADGKASGYVEPPSCL
ncbi:polygalacturonase [Setaria viridis]|nr:polygalacturonase-like [Setaria viridis]